MNSLNDDLNEILSQAINAVKPSVLIPYCINLKENQLILPGIKYNLDEYKRIFLIGAGKASAYMAKELEKILGRKIHGGLVSVKYGHAVECKYVEVIEAGHPISDSNSIRAAELILKIAMQADDNDLVLCVFSGGASALMEYLPDEISFNDYRKTLSLMLNSGADINEMNFVRKHLSMVKGGKLARAIYPADCISIIISDVIGDNISTIASGPTAADSSVFNDAMNVLDKYNLNKKIPESVMKYLTSGCSGDKEETLKSGDIIFNKVKNIVIGNNRLALKSAKKAAERLGYRVVILSDRISGEACETGRETADFIKRKCEEKNPDRQPACILFGGETTVTVKGNGKGGRNTELALAALIALKDVSCSYLLASFATDGNDGATDAAGAFITPELWNLIRSKNLDPQKFLNDNNSYEFFNSVNGLIKTGPTETNVMDIVVALIRN